MARGNLQQAHTALGKAIEGYAIVRDPIRAANAQLSAGHARILAGEIGAAAELVAAARTVFEDSDDQTGLSLVYRYEGDIARLELKFDRARALFEHAFNIDRKSGSPLRASSTRHGMAEMDRLMGHLAEAEAGYREVIAMQDAVGRPDLIPSLNLGLCLVARGQYHEARKELMQVLDVWTQQKKSGYQAVAHISLLPAVAGLHDWEAYDQHLDDFLTLSAETGMVDLDNAQQAELAAKLARAEGQVERAVRAWEVAANTWEALGEQEAANRVLDLIREHRI
jgi:tetratricopeptide (TPR) repeat protein